MTSLNGGLPPHGVPPHLVPLDSNYLFVESVLEYKKHLTVGGCRYAPIIDVWNRSYTNTVPTQKSDWCLHCYKRWLKLQAKKAKGA